MHFLQRWSWVGAITGVMAIPMAGLAWLLAPDTNAWMIPSALSPVMLTVWWVGGRNQRDTQSQHSVILGLLVAALCFAAVNRVAVVYNIDVDLSSTKQHSLSPQTIQLLKSVKEPIEILAFFSGQSPNREQMKRLLSLAESHSNLITTQWLDPASEPFLAKQYDAESVLGTVVLKRQDTTARLDYDFSEPALAGALLAVLRSEALELCFTSGHGELDLTDPVEPVAMGMIGQRLEQQHYRLRELSLLTSELPETCHVIILAGPRRDLLPQEHELLKQFLERGGNAMFLLDPTVSLDTAKFLRQYGVIVGDDFVLEQNPRYQLMNGDPSFVIIDNQNLQPHPITQVGDARILLQGLRTVGPDSQHTSGKLTLLATTSSGAWAERSYNKANPQPDQNEAKGALPIMLLVEMQNNISSESGQIIVVGSSSLVRNAFNTGATANADLFMNAVAWLVQEKAQIAERAQERDEVYVQMTALQGLVVWLICLFIAPGFILLSAISVWRERRQN